MGPVQLITSTDTVDGTVVVSVQGDVDLASSPELRRVLDDALRQSAQVHLELAGLTFIDSSGLSALVEAHRKARDAGGVLVLRNPPSILLRLLDITSLNTLLVVEGPDHDEHAENVDEPPETPETPEDPETAVRGDEA